jgi:hypothetical protein
MHEEEIVDIAAIIPNAEIVLHEMIETVQVKIGEDLARQVPYREATARRRMEQALIPGKIVPGISWTFYYTVASRIAIDDLPAEIDEDIPVIAFIAGEEEGSELVEEKPPIDMHEEAPDIQLEDIAILRVVAGATAYATIDSLYAEMGTLSVAAGIAVVDKLLFEERLYFIDEEVMDYTVAEVGGENLPLHRLFHDEVNGSPGEIAPVVDSRVQLDQIRLEVRFESQSVYGAALVAPAIEIGLEELVKGDGSVRLGGLFIIGEQKELHHEIAGGAGDVPNPPQAGPKTRAARTWLLLFLLLLFWLPSSKF